MFVAGRYYALSHGLAVALSHGRALNSSVKVEIWWDTLGWESGDGMCSGDMG